MLYSFYYRWRNNLSPNIFESYSLLVTIIATLFAIFSIALTYIGYIKYRQVDKVVQNKLNKEMDSFINSLQDELYNLQNANAKIQASYDYFNTDIDKAISLLVSASEISPKAYNLFNTLGYAYSKKKDFNSAKLMFQRAIELHPHSIQGYNDMANLCDELDDNNGYTHFYNLALKNVPNAEKQWQLVKKS